jgi:hypothetical protein
MTDLIEECAKIAESHVGAGGGPGYDEACRDIAGAIRALAVSPQTGWQPIETAPKDGKILLAWRTCRTASVGCWSYDEAYESRKWGHKAVKEGWRSEGDQCIPVNQSDCTHWQPVPALPRADGGGK